ncbi:retrovirus-related pol polyprotein from transposon TNT 1-94 [Tanacetum coccineum]
MISPSIRESPILLCSSRLRIDLGLVFFPPHLYNKEVREEGCLYRHLLFILNSKSILRVILVCILRRLLRVLFVRVSVIFLEFLDCVFRNLVNQVRMKALLEHQGLATALEELHAAIIAAYDNVIQKKAYNGLILCLGDRVLREITKETTIAGIWKKLETLYMTKSLANGFYLKKKLYTFNMHPSKSQSEHIDEFHKLVGDLVAINTTISDEDQALLEVISDEDKALLLLTSSPSSYDYFKMKEEKGNGGEGLYVRGRSGQIDMEHGAWSKSQERSSKLKCYTCQSEEHLKRDCPRKCRVRGTGKVRVQMRDGSSFMLDNVRYVPKLRRNLISLGTLEKEGFTVKMQSGMIKVIKGSLVVLSGTRRANWSCIYAVEIQEYQVVFTIPDMAPVSVGMFYGFDRGLQKNIQVCVDFDHAMGRLITIMGRSIIRYGLMIQGCARSWEAMMPHMMTLSATEAEYMTLTEVVKEVIWLNGFSTELEFEPRLVLAEAATYRRFLI